MAARPLAPSRSRRHSPTPRYLLAPALALALSLPATGTARPPDHAPAHGWRAKQGQSYMGYSGKQWQRDYGVANGSCVWREVGTVLGAATGAAIGSKIGAGEGRALAIFAGTIIGAAIGNRIGADLDGGDRGCLGHALELAPAGRTVRWTNGATGVGYAITPGASVSGGVCRDFTLTRVLDGRKESARKVACRDDLGAWRMRS